MAAQKRKSVLVEPPAKQRKLDKNSKLVSANKERKLLDAKHLSNKKETLKKEVNKSSTKTNRSATNKSIKRSSVQSVHSKQAQKCSKQASNELTKKSCTSVCVKRTSLKSSARSTKTSVKSSKINHASYLGSTKTSSKTSSGGKGKTNAIKSKTSIESRKQKLKSSTGVKKCSSKLLGSRRSAMPTGTSLKNLNSRTELVKKNSKKERTTKTDKFLRNGNVNLEVQKNTLTKNSDSQNTVWTRAKTKNYKKPCESDGMQRNTRSTGSNSNQSSVKIKQERLLDFRKTKAASLEAMQDLPKLQHSVTCDEHLTRRSLRLQKSSDVPKISLRSRKIKGNASAVKQDSLMKRQLSHIKNEKRKSVKQNMEQNPMKYDECKYKKKKTLNLEKMNSLKEKQYEADPKLTDLVTSQDKLGESNSNLDSSFQESVNEPVNAVSCSVKSTGSGISKEKELIHKNGGKSVKTKRIVLEPPSSKPADQSEDLMKSRKISILELCEEIAGEIESDTVEVKKDSNTERGKEEKDTVVELAQAAILPEEEINQNFQCKRFFPSKKGMPVKCIVNGRHSTTNKNSKWTKIKLTKSNHVNQSIPNSPCIPKLDLLKFSVPEGGQETALETHLPEVQRKLIQSFQVGNSSCEQKGAVCFEGLQAKEAMSCPDPEQLTVQTTKNGLSEAKQMPEPTPDESFNLHLDTSPESTPVKITTNSESAPPPAKQSKKDIVEIKPQVPAPKQLVRTLFTNKTSEAAESRTCLAKTSMSKCDAFFSSEENIQKLREAAKDSDKQLIIDAGQKRFGAISCNICGMLYTASNPEDEAQHLLFHNQFISAVKYVVLLINHHQCGSEEELITSFLSVFNFRYTPYSSFSH
ncbi:N-acetyltransferase ESCO1 isoform X2 [Eublepharis macularius]|uniref:N-acetyltransferase ESCO1 isoform X2 n=1 Tax=Eublepharis macularius TaxID=481883 RepID=A0AA97L3X8_EUBMA|nr:N-acetyltransferase ESCO1 isoform X2 [Eublepharis macularius]